MDNGKQSNKKCMFRGIIMFSIGILLINIFDIPNPNIVLLSIVVFFAVRRGFYLGIPGVIASIAYSAVFFSEPNMLFVYSALSVKKLILISVVAPILVILVSMLKRSEQKKTTELVKINEELQKIANTDALTGLLNRRAFEKMFFEEYLFAKDNNKTLLLAIADIDCFKAYNDTYGHVYGDYCLKDVAQALKKECEYFGGKAFRYGGEEFALILPGVDDMSGRIIGRYLLDKIRRLQIEHQASSAGSIVTVSIGMSAIDKNENLPRTLIMNADKALYQAKAKGRNNMVVYKEEK